MRKQIKRYDIAIIGNGVIGVLTSFLLKKKYPKKKICLVGNKNFRYSASYAAGAMHAVFCEIEQNFYKSRIEQSNFEIGLKSKGLWKEIFKKYNLNETITSNDTLFYLKDKCSDFEKKNFEMACEIANNHKVLEKTSKNELEKIFNGNVKYKKLRCFKIKNEFSFNPANLTAKLLDISKKEKLSTIHEDVESVVIKNEKYFLNKEYLADKLIVTGGYNSHKIVKNLFKPVPIIKGVGTALILKNDYFKKIDSVIRTSNRGGAQCGLHLVPYNKKRGEIYVGAGNYISPDDEPWARTETIKYLLRLLEDEIIPKSVIYESTIRTLLGYRPRSIDNTPSIGPVSDSLFYVSGTNSVGLSWASYIAFEIFSWIELKKNDTLLDEYKPNRSLKSWGKIEEACNYYASSRISNLIEHEIIKRNKPKLKKKFVQLYNFAKKKNMYLNKKFKFKKDFVIDPDCYSYFDKLK